MENEMPRSKVRTAVSWFFIVAIIVLIQITITSRKSVEQSADTSSIMQTQMSGKYFIGLKQLASKNPMLKGRLSKLEEDILKNPDHLKYLSGIPIIAELSGRDAALQELKRMASDPDSVPDSENLPVFYQLYHDGSASLDSEQIAILKSYGWVGRLALSQDKPDSDPERKAILRSAVRMVIIVGLLTMLALAALIGGLVLLSIAIVQAVKGKMRSHLVIPDNPGILLLETFAIYLVLSFVLPQVYMMIAPESPYGSIFLSILAGFLPILWPLLRGAGWKDYCASIGWHRGKGLFREVGAGIVGYITGLPLLLAAGIIVMILVKYTGETPSHPVVFGLSRSPLYLFLLACIYAPFVEETLFRGILYGYLRRSQPWIVSAAITGFIFGMLHPQGWVAAPALGIIGFNLCAIREWRGSAIGSMTAHALNNGSLVIILVISL